MPGPQPGGHAHQSVPLLADQIFWHASVKQRFQFAIIPVLTQLEESLMAQLGQPGLQPNIVQHALRNGSGAGQEPPRYTSTSHVSEAVRILAVVCLATPWELRSWI